VGGLIRVGATASVEVCLVSGRERGGEVLGGAYWEDGESVHGFIKWRRRVLIDVEVWIRAVSIKLELTNAPGAQSQEGWFGGEGGGRGGEEVKARKRRVY